MADDTEVRSGAVVISANNSSKKVFSGGKYNLDLIYSLSLLFLLQICRLFDKSKVILQKDCYMLSLTARCDC